MRTRAVVVAIAVAVAVVAAEEEEPRSSREDDDEEDVLFLRECWNELCRCRWPMVYLDLELFMIASSGLHKAFILVC